MQSRTPGLGRLKKNRTQPGLTESDVGDEQGGHQTGAPMPESMMLTDGEPHRRAPRMLWTKIAPPIDATSM